MLMVLSPAKKLDFDSSCPLDEYSNPLFLDKAGLLVKELKKKTPKELSKLMKISEKLGELNAERYSSFKTPFTKKKAKQAIFAFSGDTYKGFDTSQLNAKDLSYAQKSLRVLSGLYGLLSPLDLILPYRLEMGTKFGPKGFNNLYEFWMESLTKEINALAKKNKSKGLINLASKEYFSALDEKSLDIPVIHPVFKEAKKGSGDDFKVIGLFSKRARGMMARYVVKNRIKKATDLESFDESGYKFSKKDSSEGELVFYRKY
ncbi:MAG: peroxide stress protein YaaA [Bdellovibrionota bacterium]|nr:peroxide stress protein YaaA [Bdellovibrionota bacterium]